MNQTSPEGVSAPTNQKLSRREFGRRVADVAAATALVLTGCEPGKILVELTPAQIEELGGVLTPIVLAEKQRVLDALEKARSSGSQSDFYATLILASGLRRIADDWKIFDPNIEDDHFPFPNPSTEEALAQRQKRLDAHNAHQVALSLLPSIHAELDHFHIPIPSQLRPGKLQK